MEKFSVDLRRGIILDHYQNPRNRGLIEDETYKKTHQASESCIDDLHLQIFVDQNVIKDARFDGEACTISTSSTSIISEMIVGKTIEEAKEIIRNYQLMCTGEAYDEDLLEEANAFSELYKQANRIKCGLIGPEGFLLLLNGENNE